MYLIIISLLAVCIASAYAKTRYYKLPLDRDFGAHGYVAYNWLNNKGLIYKDIPYAPKTPGQHLLYMLIIKYMGISRASFRKFFALYNTATIIAVYLIGQQVYSPSAGVLAAGLFGLYSCVPSLWFHFSNSEKYYILFTCLSMLGLLWGTTVSSTALILGAGLMAGITYMFKPTAAINTILPCFLYMLLPDVLATQTWLAFLLGLSIPFIAFFTYFVLIKKTPFKLLPFPFGIANFISVVFSKNGYLRNPIFRTNLYAQHLHRMKLKGIYYDMIGITVLAIAGSIYGLSHASGGPILLTLWLWMSILSGFLGGHYLPYHFIPIVVPGCIISSHTAIEIFKSLTLSTANTSILMITCLAMISLSIFALVYHLINDLFSTPQKLLGHFYSGEDDLFAACEEIGLYIKGRTTETDLVYTWGAEQEIYLWSQRSCPTPSPFSPAMTPANLTKRLRYAQLPYLLKTPPRYFVATTPFHGCLEYEQFIAQLYTLEKTTQFAKVFILDDQKAAQGLTSVFDKLVSIIIISNNSLPDLKQCLHNLLTTTVTPQEIIIVDNNSNDGTQEFIQGINDINVILNNTDQGFAKACNQGFEATHGDFVVLLNPHTFLTWDWASRMIKHFDDKTVAVGPIANINSGDQKFEPYLKKRLSGEFKIIELADEIHVQNAGEHYETNLLQPFCLMLRRDLMLRLNEALDLDNVIPELEQRLCANGHKLLIAADTFVYLNQDAKNPASLSNQVETTPQPITSSNDRHRLSTNSGGTPETSIIIPVFNKLEYTKRCLESLIACTPQSYEVIIIDNASTDGTDVFLKCLEGDVTIITNPHNTGFATACNQGAHVAKGKYLLFLNNDTEVRANWLSPLIEVLDHDQSVAAVGSKLIYPNGSIQHAGIMITDNRQLADPLMASNVYRGEPADLIEANRPKIYQALTAACLLIRKDAFEKVSGFDENYWNGYEDVDLCFKLQECGWQLVYQPTSVVVHHESQSGPERFSQASRNIQRLHEKWLGRIQPDFIVEQNGSTSLGSANRIKPYVSEALSSIIMLTFNQLEYTRLCLESLEAHTPEAYELILVDNGSTDGTVDFLQAFAAEHSNVKLIINQENQGFAGGNNQGIAVASGDYILFLNNDTVVSPGWLAAMIGHAETRPAVGLVGPLSNNVVGPQLVENVTYKQIEDFPAFAQCIQSSNRGRSTPTVKLVGFCLLAKREVIELIGGFDEDYAIGNFEDDDLCLRATLAGYSAVIANDVFIHHFGSQTFKGNKLDYNANLDRNRNIFVAKWPDIVAFNEDQVTYTITVSPDARSAFLNKLGEQVFTDSDYRRALRLFERALKLDPFDSQALNNLGVIRTQLGEPQAGMELFIKVLKREPDNQDALENLKDAMQLAGIPAASANALLAELGAALEDGRS